MFWEYEKVLRKIKIKQTTLWLKFTVTVFPFFPLLKPINLVASSTLLLPLKIMFFKRESNYLWFLYFFTFPSISLRFFLWYVFRYFFLQAIFFCKDLACIGFIRIFEQLNLFSSNLKHEPFWAGQGVFFVHSHR